MTTTASRTAERETFLADVLVTAVEGGINYWTHTTNYHWYSPMLSGGTADPSPAGGGNAHVRLEVPEGPDGDPMTVDVTLDTIDKGLALLRSGEVEVSQYLQKAIVTSDQFNDFESAFDAIAADVVVQAGVFGKVVFG